MVDMSVPAILTRHQTDARIRRRAQTMAAVPPQVDAHLEATRQEPVRSVERVPLRNNPQKLAAFRAKYRATFRANEWDRRVYFAKLADADAVKIGYARHPEKRIKSLFYDYGIVAQLIGSIDGDWSVEKRLHRLFRRAKVHHPRVPELFAYSIIKGAVDALIAAQPEWEELSAIPWPSRTFNNAAMDALVVELTMKRLPRRAR